MSRSSVRSEPQSTRQSSSVPVNTGNPQGGKGKTRRGSAPLDLFDLSEFRQGLNVKLNDLTAMVHAGQKVFLTAIAEGCSHSALLAAGEYSLQCADLTLDEVGAICDALPDMVKTSVGTRDRWFSRVLPDGLLASSDDYPPEGYERIGEFFLGEHKDSDKWIIFRKRNIT